MKTISSSQTKFYLNVINALQKIKLHDTLLGGNMHYSVYALREKEDKSNNNLKLFLFEGQNSSKILDMDNGRAVALYETGAPTKYDIMSSTNTNHLCDLIYYTFYKKLDEKDTQVCDLAELRVKNHSNNSYKIILGQNMLECGSIRQDDITIRLACGARIYATYSNFGMSRWEVTTD